MTAASHGITLPKTVQRVFGKNATKECLRMNNAALHACLRAPKKHLGMILSSFQWLWRLPRLARRRQRCSRPQVRLDRCNFGQCQRKIQFPCCDAVQKCRVGTNALVKRKRNFCDGHCHGKRVFVGGARNCSCHLAGNVQEQRGKNRGASHAHTRRASHIGVFPFFGAVSLLRWGANCPS